MDKVKIAEFMKVLKSIPTQAFDTSTKAYLHKDFVAHNDALIGLEYLIEVHCSSDDVEPAYFCKLCEKLLQTYNACQHVISIGHRTLFLDSVKHTFDKVTSAFLARCDVHQAARIYEQMHPRKEVCLMFTRSFGKLLLQAAPMPVARINDPTIACKPPRLYISSLEDSHGSAYSNQDFLRMPTRRFGPGEKCYVHDVFEDYPDPLVGLEAVVEMRPTDAKFQSGYFCQTCVARYLCTGSIIGHLMSPRHRWTHMKMPQYASSFELAELLQCDSEDKAQLAKAASYFERKFGRQRVSFTFVDQFDSLMLSTARRADPGDLSTRKQRREMRPAGTVKISASSGDLTNFKNKSISNAGASDSSSLTSGKPTRKRFRKHGAKKVAPNSPQTQEKSCNQSKASKRVQQEVDVSGDDDGTFEISAPAFPVLISPSATLSLKSTTQAAVKSSRAAGFFQSEKTKSTDWPPGLVEQGVVGLPTGRRSWDALASQFLSGSGKPQSSRFSTSAAPNAFTGLAPSRTMVASKSDVAASLPPAVAASKARLPATQVFSSAVIPLSSKSSVSSPVLDDFSLLNDAASNADAALRESSADQLLALLLRERKAAESKDRLIAKLSNYS